MSRIEEVKELNDNIKDITEKYKDVISVEQQRDIGLGFITSSLMKTNELLAIIADDIERRNNESI